MTPRKVKPHATAKPKSQGPRKMGRPVEAVPAAVARDICEWIADGNTLREFCRQDGRPSWRTVYEWVAKDAEFAARFARARDLGTDAIAEDTLTLIDETPAQAIGPSGSRVDQGHVQWQKNRVELRLKLLAKWNPKRYGDKIDVTTEGKALGGVVLLPPLGQ